MNPLECDALLRNSLTEDAARHDITSRAVVPRNNRIKTAVIVKESGILAGIELAVRVLKLQDNSLSVRTLRKDGSAIKSGQAILLVEGNARSIMAAERTALNFLGHLSGIATLTRQFVHRAKPYPAAILDTRKTLPGLRLLEKYAVRMGGGKNHRLRLDDAVLIKTNHLRAISKQQSAISKCIGQAVRQARRSAPGRFIEIEVTNLRELQEALAAQPDAILLDNWSLADIRRAVRRRSHVSCLLSPVSLLEASGGVTLRNVRRIAATGVDRISIGALTHSAPSLDVALRVVPP